MAVTLTCTGITGPTKSLSFKGVFPTMSFPAELSNAIDGITEVVAAHLNNLEAKVGTDNSAVVTSLDYLLKNAGSIDPGHKHAAGALSGGNNGEVLYKAAGAWGPGTPDTAGLVAKSGDQSIEGLKTFTSIPVGPASNPTTANQLARKAYVDTMLPLSGGTMAGNIAMDNYKVTGLAAASGAGQAVRYDEWTTTQDPGHKHSKLWASDGSPEAVTVDAAGNVGIGTTSPLAQLQVNSNTLPFAVYGGAGYARAFAAVTWDINPDVGVWLGTNLGFNTNATIGSDNGSRVMTLTSGGNVGIGTTSPEYLLTCNGEPGANGYTAWTNYSDIRVKQDIVPLKNNLLTKVLKLNPITFSYNDKNPWGEKPGERRLYGFIAQELQELFPDMVGEAEGSDGEKYLTTNLSNLTLYLVQAIKEQQAQIEALKAKVN
jgi:hypothetical protein